MMDKDKIFKRAKELVQKRLGAAPDFTIFQSIDAQLDYIIGLLDGNISDRSQLKNVNVGLYAIREFEESDPEFAKELKKIQYIADKMRKGLKID